MIKYGLILMDCPKVLTSLPSKLIPAVMSDEYTKVNDFFIGWQEKMPAPYIEYAKLVIITLVFIVVSVSVLLVFSQDEFEDSKFELGKISEIEGILVMDPIPMIKIYSSSNPEVWNSVLLIGYGKFGAENTIEEIEAKNNSSLNRKWVKLRGTKIYHEGKYAFELTEGAESYLSSKNAARDYKPVSDIIGRETLFGEILDPKCALGVMKPGFGKIHRSCAIRCITGGIPPIFRITNKEGKSNYALLKGPNGESINLAVLPFVADQMRLCGRLEQQDDWLILYTDPATDFVRLKPQWMEDDLILCSQ